MSEPHSAKIRRRVASLYNAVDRAITSLRDLQEARDALRRAVSAGRRDAEPDRTVDAKDRGEGGGGDG